MKLLNKKKGLTILLCAVLVLLGLVLLRRHYAVNDLDPTGRILPVPVVYGGETGDGLARETEIRFFGRKQAEVEDTFVLQNRGQQAQSYTVVYPVLPATEEELGEISELWVNGTRCTEYLSAEALRFSYGADLTPLEDGTWFRQLFPEGLEHWSGESKTGKSSSADCVRYYVRECVVSPGQTLEIRASFRYGSTAVFRFCANYEEAPVEGHSLKLSGTGTVAVGGNVPSGRQLTDGTLELDPNRKDYYLASRAYQYR